MLKSRNSIEKMKLIAKKIDLFTGHRDSVYHLAHSLKDRHFLSVGGDGLLVEWNIDIPDLGHSLAKVNNSIYAMAVDMERGEIWLGHNYEGLHVIDYNEKKEVASIALNKTAIFIELYYKFINCFALL